jgi:hypothetical protein
LTTWTRTLRRTVKRRRATAAGEVASGAHGKFNPKSRPPRVTAAGRGFNPR